jgi:SAM-dependent methyltransferase
MSSAYRSHDIDEERRRLRLQSETLEEIGELALASIPLANGGRALDVACGAMGLLGPLSRRVGANGSVVGTDISEAMLEHAQAYCVEHDLRNVTLIRDDAYATSLSKHSFDLVHARFLLAPIGRDETALPELESLVKPDGFVLLEEPDATHWVTHPRSVAHERLVAAIVRAYDKHMGGFNAGLRLLGLARSRGWRDVGFAVRVAGLRPGHPYLRGPAMFAKSLRSVLLRDTAEAELDRLVAEAETDYSNGERFGTTYAVVQVWGRPAAS